MTSSRTASTSPRRAGQRAEQPRQPGVDALVAALDEAVGVEGERGAGREVDDDLRRLADLGDAERGARSLEQPRRRAGDDERGGRVAGVDEAQAPLVGLDDGVDQRRHVVGAQRLVVEVQPRDDVGRRMALDRVGARDAAQLAHARGRAHAAAGDVADDQAEAAAGQGEGVEPVAAHRGALAARGEVRRSATPGRVGQPAGEEVALQRGGDRALALVGRLGLGAPGALLGQALAGGLGAAALAQVVDLDEHGEDLAVVLAHAPGQDRDREVLVAGELQLGGRRHGGARQRGGQQRVEREPVVELDQRADRDPGHRAALGELLQHRVGAQQAPVAVDERRAGRQRPPREQQHLVGARAGAPLALEVAEDADLRAQHVRARRA